MKIPMADLVPTLTQRRNLLESFAMAILLAPCLSPFSAVSAQGSAMNVRPVQEMERHVADPKDVQTRGTELRTAIDKRYKELAEAGAIKSMGNGRNLITDTVVQYIPLGIAFADAEAILKAAGFVVGPRTTTPVSPNYYSVSAAIEQYVPTLFGKTSVFVDLEPPSPTDWTTVRKLSAEITKQFI